MENTIVTKEEMKTECLKRLEMLNVHPNVMQDFSNGVLNCSDNPSGSLCWLDDDMKKSIKKFENEYGGMVYHVIKSWWRTSGNSTEEHWAFLYVSKHKNEWNFDRELISNMTPYAYVVNCACEWCSEIGSIGIHSHFGGVIRTC